MKDVEGIVANKPAPQTPFVVKQMGPRDISITNKIFVQSMEYDYDYFPDYFKKQLIREHSSLQLLRSLISPKSCILLAQRGIDSLGYCVVRLERSEPATLLWIYVDSAARGMGVGRELVCAALQRARQHKCTSMQLFTHDKEEFFARHKFILLRRIPGMLAGVDMAIMKVEL